MPLTVSKLTVLKQTAPKLIAAAVLAGALALTTAPARSADTVSPNDTARFLAGMVPTSDSPLAALYYCEQLAPIRRGRDWRDGLRCQRRGVSPVR